MPQREKRLRFAVIPTFVLVGAVVGVLALEFTGAAHKNLLNDAGPYVRFGLPAVKFLFNLAMSLTIASLVFAATIIPRRTTEKKRRKHKEFSSSPPHEDERHLNPLWVRALGIAQIASVVWTLSSVAVLILTYLDTAGGQAYKADLSAQLGVYITQVDYGRVWLLIVLMIAVISTLVFALRSLIGVGLTCVLAVLTLVPQALLGHASEATGHTQAVNSIGLHLLSVTLWLGGLLVLALLAPQLSRQRNLDVIIRRYSTLALISIVLMVYSGLVNATLRIGDLADWMTPYAQVVLLKIALTVVLAGFGWVYRQRVIGQLPTAKRGLLWRMVGMEALIFGAVMSLGVVLARSQPPIPDTPPAAPSPAEILTSEPLPPPPVWQNYFLQWEVDPLWVVITVGASVAYVLAFIRLRHRGDNWPVGRMIFWLLGMAMVFYITCGGPMVYGQVLFSGHMVQHMLIVMGAPLPLVLGAPITLLMRAVKPRNDGSRGLREWVLLLVHSKYMRFWAHPIVASINFAGSLVVFYYSGIMPLALGTHIGHELMLFHFLAAGYLFAQAMVGLDPGTKEYPYPVRLLILLVTMAFHAFFGISIISSTYLIAGEWFGNMGHGWFPALDDQILGGQIAWGMGEFPTLGLAVMVAVQWARASDREAKRTDRSEERSNDAQLAAYNDMLARMHARDNQPTNHATHYGE